MLKEVQIGKALILAKFIFDTSGLFFSIFVVDFGWFFDFHRRMSFRDDFLFVFDSF